MKDLDRGELVAIVGGVLLFVSLFLGWYVLNNKFAIVGPPASPVCSGKANVGGLCTGWQALGPLSYILALFAIVPFILAVVIITGAKLSWPRGELTAVIALIALTLIVYRGVIQRPGWPSGEVGLSIGWFMALLGGVLIFIGALTRAQESNRRQKPPGIL